MGDSAASQYKNLFLNGLPPEDSHAINSCLELVEMPLGMKVYQPNAEIEYVYFPETSIISIVTLLENGSGIETGIVGKEGFSGIETILSENSSPREAKVQLGGTGYRMSVPDFKTVFADNKIFSAKVLHYLYAFITQIAQNSVCLCYHPIEKRLARWLLMFHERAASDELKLTQEFIALMLGVHRPNLNKNIGELQKKKLVSYNRGLIAILDRQGLKKVSCECYESIRRDFDKYLQNNRK